MPVEHYTPAPYQKYCFDRILDTPFVGLFLGCGLGKTSITLSAINVLMRSRLEVRKPLIVAPKKVTERTWQAEAAKWYHLQHITFQLIDGTPAQRKKQLEAKADIYIVGRDIVHWVVDQYADPQGKEINGGWPFDMLVLDESSSFKSHSSRRTKSIMRIRKHCNRVVLLTGTPAPKSYEDLFSQIRILDLGERLRPTITSFRAEFEYIVHAIKPGVYKYAMRPEAKTVIDNLISDIVVCLKTEDYITLPDTIYEESKIVLDKKAQEAYNKFEKEMLIELADAEVFATEQAGVSMKLRQLCNGAVYDRDGNWHKVHTCKVDAVVELLESLLYEGRSCLVYYAFKFDVEMLTEALSKHPELKHKTVKVLKGKEEEKEWNEKKIDILLAHPASCAHGLNLQYGGSDIIWYGLTDNLEHYEQGNARLPRRGQERPVCVHIPTVEGGRDEDLVALLGDKADVQNGLKDSLQEKIKSLIG